MATHTERRIRDADEEALRIRAARNRRSMESQLRAIRHEALTEDRVAAQPRPSLVRAEILHGLHALPDGGMRRRQLAAAENVFGEFAAIRPFTAPAAAVCGGIATCDVADFEGCGVEVIGPWAVP